MEPILKLYAVRNKDGKYFRAKGFGGYGDTWVDDIRKAKIYPKIGQAKSRCTWFANEYPKYGIPDVIEFSVTSAQVLDQTEQVAKAKAKKEKKIAKRQLWEKEYNLSKARSDLERAQKEIERLS